MREKCPVRKGAMGAPMRSNGLWLWDRFLFGRDFSRSTAASSQVPTAKWQMLSQAGWMRQLIQQASKRHQLLRWLFEPLRH
jgi:hypothetical protein